MGNGNDNKSAPTGRKVSRRGLFSAFLRKGAVVSVAAGSNEHTPETDAANMGASLRPQSPEQVQAFLQRLADKHRKEG